LRQAIATYVAKSRAIDCASAQVLILSGSQQALDLCARVLIDQENAVSIENPGYPGTHSVFRAHGARVHTVPVDGDGIVVRRLKRVRVSSTPLPRTSSRRARRCHSRAACN
jgi:GntR family transcriptional regulator/MocR family aminotransferase